MGCTSRWVDSSLSFHRIPKEEKQHWLNVIKRKHWAPTNNDLSPIENFGDYLGQRIRRCPNLAMNRDKLVQALRQEWRAIRDAVI